MGRMLEPQEIAEDVIAFFQPKRLAGRRVLLTAGPTFEPIDPVRGITNLSSGKMGYALARACREAGADVTLVSGPTALPCPRGVERIDVQTARQMLDAVMARAGQAHVFIAVAAVADWRVDRPSTSKIKKGEAGPPSLSFVENPDILATVAAMPNAPYCVGFAAESEALERNAAAKRERKGVPLLIGNLGQATFGLDDNEVAIIDAHGIRRLPRGDKLGLSREIVAEIASRLGGFAGAR